MRYSLLCGGAPEPGELHIGFFVIPQGEQWSMTHATGEVVAVDGPLTVRCFNTMLTRRQLHVAAENEYLEVRFAAGHSEVLPGPYCLFEDPILHKRISSHKAVSVNNNEALVVYREETSKGGEKLVRRDLVRGPVLYKPATPNEWRHSFSWHGHDPSGGDIARKRAHGLKFEKMMLAPSSTYYDVENVRTADDALLTVRLMIFYKVVDVETMLDSTNDPIADIINSVSSDVIGFCSARSFEQFKETSESLNSLGAFPNLVESVGSRGVAVSKVVFRGYMAPQRLQKMHDEAIEKRTRLVLERESESQEHQLADERLAKEEERAATKRLMAKKQAQHEAEMQRAAFEANQREEQEGGELEVRLQLLRQETELKHVAATQRTVNLQPSEMAQLLIAREQGPPARLIQIAGDCRPVVQVGDGPADVAEVDDAAGGSSSVRGRLAMRRNPSPKPQQLFNR